ncbi:hypothetical protein KKE26_04480 [bacterium]|nr:hypothetical protein [bacterium]MBU1754172.1 hypothetical protein [bacterium]
MKMIKFNCVEMKRHGAEKVAEKIKHMTKEQELAFWQEQTQQLKNYQELIKQGGNSVRT